MNLNWSLNQHIPMERYQFLLLMLRRSEIGIHWVTIRVVWVVLQHIIWNPRTWGGIHLLQAGEPGQMETATVNWMYKLQPSAFVGGFCSHWIFMLNGHACVNCCQKCVLMRASREHSVWNQISTYSYWLIDTFFIRAASLTPLPFPLLLPLFSS